MGNSFAIINQTEEPLYLEFFRPLINPFHYDPWKTQELLPEELTQFTFELPVLQVRFILKEEHFVAEIKSDQIYTITDRGFSENKPAITHQFRCRRNFAQKSNQPDVFTDPTVPTVAAVVSGNVVAGSMVAASMRTIGSVGSLAGPLGVAVSLGAGAIVGGVVYGSFKLHDALKYHSDRQPCWDFCHEEKEIHTASRSNPTQVRTRIQHKEQNICVICEEDISVSYSLIHEGTAHSGYCSVCAKFCMNRPCPICRKRVEAIVQLFDS